MLSVAAAALVALLPVPVAPGVTCATINNTSNVAVWRTATSPVRSATYRDQGGPRLIFSRPVPRAVRAAEAKLQIGAPGPKVRTACSR